MYVYLTEFVLCVSGGFLMVEVNVNFGLLNRVLLHDFFNVCIDMYHFVLYMKLAVCNNKNYKKKKKC